MELKFFRASQTLSRALFQKSIRCSSGSVTINYQVMHKWPPEKFDKHFIDYLSRPEIDGWEVRKAFTELHNFDLIPDPKVIIAGLRACRRVNDFSLAVRFLEGIKFKCGSKKTRKIMYPWIINEIRPVLNELGVSTPEELGLDVPELYIPQPAMWWEKEWYAEYGYDKMPGYEHFAKNH